jgi:hypothetical protein
VPTGHGESEFHLANVYWIGRHDKWRPHLRGAAVSAALPPAAVSEVDHEAIFDSGMRARLLYGHYS